MIKLSLLGTGGMMPLPNRFLTSLLLSSGGKMILIDCGEGTQISLKSLAWGLKSIDIICFTHYHADHIAGLPGLLSTIANSGKVTPLTLIGPKGLKEVVSGLTVITPILPYDINFLELEDENLRDYTEGNFTISTIDLDHHITCLGYSIEIKRNKRFNVEKALQNNIPKVLWNRLQKGEIIEYDDRTITPDMVLGESRQGIKICYCTDTRPIPSIIPFIKNADLFICEGMYGEDEFISKAIEKKHMTFSEAALLAREGEVNELWLTHFSPAVQNPEEFLSFATNTFKNTIVAHDRIYKELEFK